MIDISVIIPTYNRERLIGKAIESVLKQEGDGEAFKIKEIWIVDDGSSDDTEAVVRVFRDERINYYKQKNGGAGCARNQGVRLAQSEWIAFQDSDDIWRSNKLKKQTEYLNEHKDCLMVVHPIRAFFIDGSEICMKIPPIEDQIKALAEHNFVDTPTILVNREIFLECGGFDESFRALEDWEYAIRFADKYEIGIIREILLDADMTTSDISSDRGKYFKFRSCFIAKNRAIFQKHGCFENAVKSFLEFAQSEGVLEQAGKMLELYLKQY